MPRWALYLLGPPRLERDGVPIHIKRRKTVALLAYLAVSGAGKSHSREGLVTLLSPEFDPSRARASLRRCLSDLNQMLDHRPVIADRETVVLNPQAGIWVDVREFLHLLAERDTHHHPRNDVCAACRPQLEAAVALYGDGFMAGFSLRDSLAFDEWQRAQTDGLGAELARTLQCLANYYKALGECEAAIAYMGRCLGHDPLNEDLHREMMELHTRAGRRDAALRQYRSFARMLKEELGVLPSAETTALYERIVAGEIVAVARSADPPHNLPVQSTPFVGREKELAEIEALLEDRECRFLTLVGVGGSGKTRLALEVAARRVRRYPHGVVFVSLAPLNSAGSIVPTTADALGIKFYEGGEPQQQLLDYLRGKTMLLIMDNYEHLLRPLAGADNSGTELVTQILRSAPGVKILATSRERLNVGGEYRYQVAGMRFPTTETPFQGVDETSAYCAVELFTQGARRASQEFRLTEENIGGVVEICRLVEGMPLAIRLAAPWVAVMSPRAIAAQLARSLDMLATDRQDVPERQRSVWASLHYTWRMLTGRERELMGALSVFRGGFTLEAAQQVSGVSLFELKALVDKSLVLTSSMDRYEIHELLRQYGQEKAGAPTAAHDQHCAYYAAAAKRWGTELQGPRQIVALEEIRADQENVDAAWEWALAHRQVSRLDQALDGWCRFLNWRGRFREGQALCREAAESLRMRPEGDAQRLLVRLLLWEADYCLELEQLGNARATLTHCFGLLGELEEDSRKLLAVLLHYTGRLEAHLNNTAKARRLFEESLVLWQTLGDRWWQANALAGLGWADWHVGAYREAQQKAEQSLAIRQSLGDKRAGAWSLELLGLIAAYSGRMNESVRLRREMVTLRVEIGDRPGAASGLGALATGLVWSGAFDEAEALLKESLEVIEDLGLRERIAESKLFLGWIDVQRGRYEQARVRVENSLLSFSETSSQRLSALAFLFLGMLELADRDYVNAQCLLREAADLFEEIRLHDELGIAKASQGYLARALGQPAQARGYLCEALRLGVDVHAHGLIIMAIPAAALLLADAGRVERAVEIYAMAIQDPYISKSRFYEDIVGQHIAAVTATLPPDVVAAAQERGRALDWWQTAEALLRELN
jgi:predicted ATPase/DNA-binding SARP family transcriptional activator